ncbi:hypothetical protein [Vibrio gazogenes]|uniref:Uncharacterized protein n=1 Tax=Vibrio gazogenes TaxID=687 RepID=A0A1Z2SEF9_VIBGA|nr:hypothetical protein [Vibrio gazogenes]ASA55552.1 hypothetical protein BSQ33_07450 [Vibrio gazogenes]
MLSSRSFIAERAALLKKLDQSFTRFSSRAINIPAFRQVKKSLRLSTKSVIHHADEIIAKGTVPSLGKRVANISKGVASAKSIGYVGLVLGAASGVNSVYEACTIDGAGECGKTITRETGGFLGSWGGGVAGGVGGGAAGKALGDVFYEYVVEPVKELFE